MNKFCPKCGKLESKNSKLINGLCSNCISGKTQMLKEYKLLKIILCQRCNSYLDKNKWHKKFSEDNEKNVEEIIKILIPEKFKPKYGTKIKSVRIDSINKIVGKNNFEAEVSLKGSVEGKGSKERYIVRIIKENTTCNLCKKKGSNYFEAIIQIRPKNKELLKFIKNDMEADGKIFISKEEEKKFGYDLYITSKNYLQSIMPKLKKEFSVETKISATLFGKKDGQDVYRVTLLIRLKE